MKSLKGNATAALLFLVFLFPFHSLSSAAGKNTIENGKKVKMHYILKADGILVEDTHSKEPSSFIYGTTPLVPGLQKILPGMKAGDKKTVKLKAEEAFGQINPNAITEVPKNTLPAGNIQVGATYTGTNAKGQPMRATVKEVKKDTVVMDFNHPLAGKALEFDIEIVEVA